MKKIFNYLLIGSMALTLFSCKQDQYMLYDTVSYIQFGPEYSRIYRTDFNFSDTVKSYSFYYDDTSVTQTDVYFDLYVIGGPKNYDRPFVLRQINIEGTNNAVPGVDYVAFNSEEMKELYVIPKGEVHILMPIRINRSATDDVYTLQFELVETTDFRLGQENLLWRRVEFTSDLQKPSNWSSSVDQYYFGVYSRTKHEFMIQTTGNKWDAEYLAAVLSDLAEEEYWEGFLTLAINALNAEREAQGLGKLTDENGIVISFP